HVDLISALLKGPAPAAAEMRKHLQELEQSLAGSPPPQKRLRDAFAHYRGGPPAPGANNPI
ncbi:MAG: GntR family transcriptional regulator, partial [Burkholderiaceae bacterium]|nr:GntR family transcriptional regulator [Burkholderiaceae bacterium]